ncbi:hypothetical protein BGZ49_002367 [Haplosporangium sp. Z 27]|nr:hypothetical protein BGZ49_002367 [Haplosporangium sp. Z 27]
MKLILFRHGNSLANQESRIVSSLENGTMLTGGPEGTGFGLSQKGRLEVAESVKSLWKYILESLQSGDNIKIQILTSPFQRTSQTADIVDKELRAAAASYNNQSTLGSDQEKAPSIVFKGEGPEQVIGLRERFFGEFEMKTPSEDLYSKVWEEDALDSSHKKYGVESPDEVSKRMSDVIRDIELKDKEHRSSPETHFETWAIIVSHGDSLQILQTAMRGWSPGRHRELENLSTAKWRQVEWCEELANI